MKKIIQLIIIFLFFFPCQSLGEIPFLVENLTTRDGLSQNTVKYLMQDSHGFIWLGTLNGLNRYDGNEFKVMLPEYGKKITLSDNRIRTVYEDNYGYIWVQTNTNIVNCYDTRLEQFVNFHSFSKHHSFISFSKTGDVWLWGNSGCLQVIHKGRTLVSRYFDKNALGSEDVNAVFEDSQGIIWIGTKSKLFSFENNKLLLRAENADFYSIVEQKGEIFVFTNNSKLLIFKKQQVRELKLPVGNKGSELNYAIPLSSNTILITSRAETFVLNTESSKILPANYLFGGESLKNVSVYYDNKKNPWLYNKTGNVWQLNAKTSTFRKIEVIPSSLLSFIDQERYSIYHDSRNIIWITTYGNGLFALNQNTGEVVHLKQNKNQAGGLNTNYLLSIIEDKSGEIWVGTEFGGVCKISMIQNRNDIFYPGEDDNVIRLVYEDAKENLWLGTKNGNLYIYSKERKQLARHAVTGGMPYALTEDSSGNKWIGTKGKGLVIFDKDNYNKYSTYPASQGDNSVMGDNLYAICKDSKGRMWLGTFGDGILLAERHGSQLVFRKFPVIKKHQSNVRSILQDRSGLIWVGGNSGVIVFDPDKLIKNGGNYVSFQFNSQNFKSINNNEVKVIFEDRAGRIWLGTSGGLNLVMREEKTEKNWFKHFTSNDGLINNIVQGIQEDSEGNLWISTEGGISKFSIKNSTFENYTFSDNWEKNLFCESAFFKQKSGNILFGSYNGLYIIKPNTFINNMQASPVLITSLKIKGNNVQPGDKDSPLKEAIYLTKKIKLRYDQNSFNIQFAILNFHNPTGNIYSYILEGYEKSWNLATKHSVAAYRNIPPGKYVFKVRGTNSSEVRNTNVTLLEITVVPPFWRSSQAILIYLLLLMLIGFIAFRIILKINRLNTAVKIEKQLTEYKLKFFTNISHEFRTPLTIIQGTIENLSSHNNIPLEAARQIGFLEKSSQRLLRLINQLLEFRRLQYNVMELTLEQTEIISFLKDIFSLFEDIAEKKGIAYFFNTPVESLNMLIDQSKMNKIVHNLLSNAFKFAPENGIVNLDVDIDNNKDILSISVSDNGIGISKENRDMLFVRFKQITPSSIGSGIGLHFTSELVKAHLGEIYYKDSNYGGACFVVNIPLSEKAYSKEVILPKEEDQSIKRGLITTPECDIIPKNIKQLNEYKLLIIEDDPEICEFLSVQLNSYFQVITAPNGKAGFEKCIGEQPHLIVCDVMMPEMDGFELTKRLKAEFQTCHIPIIMLTAYNSMEHQIQGIEAGADVYITKPFSVKYLMLRIIKLIEQREMLYKKQAQKPGLTPMPVFTVAKDNDFMKKIHEIVEQNIENPQFSIDTFSSAVGMGRTVFFKKIKGLTGYTPNDFIRVARMKKAAELLVSSNLNVSEVAYKVGINNPFYFSKCFKEQFGITPSEFAKKGNPE